MSYFNAFGPFRVFGLAAAMVISMPTFASSDSLSEEGSHETPQGHVAEHAEEHGDGHGEEKEFNFNHYLLDHIQDSHDWHLWDWDGHAVSIPLPVILWDGGLQAFMSSKFEHGHAIAESGGNHYMVYEGTVYKVSGPDWIPEFDKDGHISNAETPLDFSITKNVASMLIGATIIFLLFFTAARRYKSDNGFAPRGLASWLEPLVLFVREEIARPNLGEKHYRRFVPFLLTAFFFIWLNNLLGLIPFFPGGANVTGNIAVTAAMALIVLILILANSNKHYWQHIFAMPGVPIPILLIMIPVEIVGIFAKPIALMIRLFANITAGHIVILSFIGLIFLWENVGAAGLSVPFALFISVLELLVAALQAYIFCLLAAMFIGQAVAEGDH